jgi:hypothetical protein
VALAVSADQVHGQTASHEHDSKYFPANCHAMTPPSQGNQLPTRLPHVVVIVNPARRRNNIGSFEACTARRALEKSSPPMVAETFLLGAQFPCKRHQKGTSALGTVNC